MSTQVHTALFVSETPQTPNENRKSEAADL
jgi:hypothetical protein